MLWRRFIMEKEQFENKNKKGKESVKGLWHGTGTFDPEKIYFG